MIFLTIAVAAVLYAHLAGADTIRGYDMYVVTETLVADGSGAFPPIETGSVSGYVVRCSTFPGTPAPTSGAADFYVTDSDGAPVSGAAMEDIATASSGSFMPLDSNGYPVPMYVGGPLTISGSADNLQAGAVMTIKIYIRR